MKKRRGSITATLLIAGVVALTGWGVKEGVDAHDNNKQAEIVRQNAVYIYDTAKRSMEDQRIKTNTDLEQLGRSKLRSWTDDIGGFVKAFEKFKNVELTGDGRFDELSKVPGGIQQALRDMRQNSLTALQLIGGTGGAVGAGVLAGVATTGSVVAFASASTGTAIAALHGIAATNATLAWIGGGTLAAGGLGVAGGTAILGGIFVAPIIAVGGALLNSRAEANLEKARAYQAEARSAAAEMRIIETTLVNISDLSRQCDDFIREFSPRFQLVIRDMNAIYGRHTGISYASTQASEQVDFRSLERNEQYTLLTGCLMAETLKKLMEAPLLTEKGEIDGQIRTIISNCRDVSSQLRVQGI